ncbi:UDP-N-acetylglucosamine 1-carboxyvinyltransferase [Bosea thiooxidans]|uniref:UDP-N-acetylglucosamine 1-carboxyvinyltransferase n=1 Tax=Bosea thiooxidans TaxID=53254 RepID=A0A0Q3I751_9HYPH|nr:UDP-N-acetylglucosamine 1-carboxyvinyltransferase [Bosea thiooxidans]KQK30685.1 UDP-N-acetylglucosamine 1-carboxyvinyltransferase [Bosea thiooxidans]SKC08821.1 UDP-N-acetylglucosamine 1-carboxyvinyltransferase [Bosea thiooxidans]
MDKLLIRGGQRLSGTVEIRGAKNAALPAFAASLLSDKPLTLRNLPDVVDVKTMQTLLEGYGVAFTERGTDALMLDAAQAGPREASYDTVRKMRATILVLGPLVARFGEARVSLPGGCAIGARPVDLHIKALEALGAEIDVAGGYIEAKAPRGLSGARIVFPFSSVGATETALLAASRAKGETEIVNAAKEPEVLDLARCLSAMGVRIEGIGSHRLLVQGAQNLSPATHEIVADRIEAGTYAVAAAITGGELELVGARLEHLAAVGEALEAAGVRLWPSDRGLMVTRPGRLTGIDIMTQAYPGFSTDLQAQFMALMSVADGTSLIRETVFENRFMHVPELVRLGADITLKGTSATVRGVASLKAAPVMATDLRASVSLVLAGLVAEGETVVSRIYHLDRGYEALDRKLKRCGADIERIPA